MAAALALASLLLLPGALVARAPWTAVPAISLAFWALSAPWLPAQASRASFLAAALLVSALLLLLRLLPKHEQPPPPGWVGPPEPPPLSRPGRKPPPLASAPSLLVAAVAVALLLSAALWRNPPGPALAFQAAAARLVVWRDGLPFSAEPLLPVAPFGAHAPAFATLSADLSRLSGLEPSRAVLVVLLAGASLTLVGLFALLAVMRPPAAAALAALVALGAVPWPGWVEAWGAGAGLLALAFLLPAAALLVGHASRSSAFAAGLLLGAAALCQPLLAAVAFACSAVVALRRARRPAAWRRLTLVIVAGAVLATPGLLPLARALSTREAVDIVGSVTAGECIASAFALLAAGLASALAVRLAEASRPVWRATRWAAGLAAGALLVARVEGWIASGQLPPGALEALARASAATDPLEAVCAGPGLRDWLPAIAGRAAGPPGPWIPAVYADEWRLRPVRDCAVVLATESDIVSRRDGKPPNGSSVLIGRRGSVTLPTR